MVTRKWEDEQPGIGPALLPNGRYLGRREVRATSREVLSGTRCTRPEGKSFASALAGTRENAFPPVPSPSLATDVVVGAAGNAPP